MNRFLVYVTIVILALAATGMAAKSPIDKGSKVLVGTVYFSFQSGDLYEDSHGDGLLSIGNSIETGYFLSPGFELGVNYALLSLKRGDASVTTFSLGPEIGYYFGANRVTGKIKGSWYPYVKGAFLFTSLNSGGGSADGSSVAGKVGLVHMLSNAVAEDIRLIYQHDTFESVSGTTMWFGVGITAFIW